MNIIESYEINNILYVNARFLSSYFNRSAKQISRWKQDGLPCVDKPKELQIKGDVFILSDCIEWVAKNINASKSRLTDRVRNTEVRITTEEDIDETVTDINGKIKQANELLQLKGTTLEDADRIKKILDGLIQTVKLGEQTKELIPKKDTEKVIVEFASMLITGYKRDINILSKECANRSEDEIRNILEKTYKTNIEQYQKIAKSKILSDEKIYDILQEFYVQIHSGVSPSDIIKKIKG